MIYKYIKEVCRHTVNIYSFLSILLCIICFIALFIFPEKKDLSVYLGIFFILLSIVIGNYYAWKELFEKFMGELKIVFTPHYIGSGFIGNGDILKETAWYCDFEISNSADGSYYLRKWEIENIDFDNDLISCQNIKKFMITENSYGCVSISSPFEITSKTKKILKAKLPLNLKSDGPERLAKKINDNDIKPFSVTLKIIYENLQGDIDEQNFSFVDNFEQFKTNVQNHWKEDKKFEKFFLLSNQK